METLLGKKYINSSPPLVLPLGTEEATPPEFYEPWQRDSERWHKVSFLRDPSHIFLNHIDNRQDTFSAFHSRLKQDLEQEIWEEGCPGAFG